MNFFSLELFCSYEMKIPLHCLTNDYVEMTSSLVLAIGGVVTALKLAYDYQKSVTERKEDLKFRKRSEALRHLDAIKTDHRVRAALTMIDYPVSSHLLPGAGSPIHISQQDIIRKHLSPNNKKHDSTDLFVRDCFDELLINLEEICGMIKNDLAPAWIFRPSLEHYCKVISNKETKIGATVQNYAERVSLGGAAELYSIFNQQS